MRNVLLPVVIFGIIFSCIIPFTTQTSLYLEDDPLWELDSKNFGTYVFGKNKAWIIEFYNNWCGHCIRFAPVWRQFARDVDGWRNVIDVGVVNCNEEKNTELCRRYNIKGFPMIKLFWHTVNETDQGELLTKDRSIPTIQATMIEFLESHWKGGVPQSWPVLAPVREVRMKSLKSLFAEIANGKDFITFFVENPDSLTGRKVILDLSFYKYLNVRRLLTTNGLFSDLKSIKSNNSVPALLRLYRNGKEELVMTFPKDENDTVTRDKVFEHLVGKPRDNFKIEITTEKPTLPPITVDSVSMTDLENAVYNSLHNEVGVTKEITGEKMSALIGYLAILKSYFPGSSPVMRYLSRLYTWVSYKKSVITGEEFVRKLEELQGENEYLPRLRDYVGCRGSEPKYRGYPCSLWTLFHTLTVQADKANKRSQEDDPKNAENSGGEVLFMIRDYIENFFTCNECVENFMKMATNMEKDVNSSKSAVIWLWEHHNQVNRRLAGDLTEDPRHPKIQFPSTNACPKCQHEIAYGYFWNTAEVMSHLHNFYSKENIANSVPMWNEDSLDAGEHLPSMTWILK